MTDARPERMCVLPWISMHVATDGAISPCCEYKGSYANLSGSTLSEAWQSAPLAEIRQAFAEGKVPGACAKCLDREASEGDSLRLQSNARFPQVLDRLAHSLDAPPFPTALDLRFSNLCNFKCRSCWHGASSKWFTDAKALGQTVADTAEITSFDGVEDFMRQVGPGLHTLEDIYFAGGEPLLFPEHYALLDRLIEMGRTDITLRYNTNMSVTTFKSRSILDLWPRFERVDVHASIDAAGDLGAYLRTGFSWETFVGNVARVRDRCPDVALSYGITVSALNIHALPDLFEALETRCGADPGQFFLHSLQDPKFYRTQALPRAEKAAAARRLHDYIADLQRRKDVEPSVQASLAAHLRGLIDYMMVEAPRDDLRRLVKRSRKLDALREEDSGAHLPHLRPYLKGWAGMRGLLKARFSRD